MVEQMERYGNGKLDLEFRQIAITADDVRSGRLTTRDVKYMRYREECLSEGSDPHTAVEVEALRPKLLRQRPDEVIAGLADDVRQWNIKACAEGAERELLRSLQGTVKKIVQHTAHGNLLLSWET
ncbi:hypothetical protein [Streptomyces sp. NPDC018352]|uniref:hypothetical protein n=1 Tax=Streptomyces sp. NPDC018352 TaxID=3157194 RepID=UPI00341066F7